MSETLRYDAFISYRHQQPDKAWADWLARALETYSLPRTLRKSLSERGLRSRVARVFRDEDETSAGGDLSQQLKTALEQSGTLIVICSRNTPASIWVNQEVEYFKSLGRAARVLPLLIDGLPAESFPPALRDQTSARIAVVATDVEPLAADGRPVPGISAREVKRRALLKLVAGALDVRYDDLYQRDGQRRRQQLMIRISGLSGAIGDRHGAVTWIVLRTWTVPAHVVIVAGHGERGERGRRHRVEQIPPEQIDFVDVAMLAFPEVVENW